MTIGGLRVATFAFVMGLVSRAGAAEPGVVEVRFKLVSVRFSEEEGGSANTTYYPSGWMHFSGQPSCCGYKPPLENGWYRMPPKLAQALFDGVAQDLALGRAVAESTRTDRGASPIAVTLLDGRQLVLEQARATRFTWPTEGGRLRPTTQNAPKGVDQQIHVGHHAANLDVLRVLEGDVARASTLPRDDVERVIAALLRDESRDMTHLERVTKILGHLPDAAIDRVAAMLNGPRPTGTQVADVIEALGEHRAAATPYVRPIVLSITDDKTLIAAAVALSRIPGNEAAQALSATLPRLGEAPREKNLQGYYRLGFARTLRSIDTPEARQLLATKVLPGILAHLQSAPTENLGDAAQAIEIWRGLPEEKQLVAADEALLTRLLRSAKSDERRIASEHLFRRYAGKPPAPLRVELERLRADPDAGVRSWVHRALGN